MYSGRNIPASRSSSGGALLAPLEERCDMSESDARCGRVGASGVGGGGGEWGEGRPVCATTCPASEMPPAFKDTYNPKVLVEEEEYY